MRKNKKLNHKLILINLKHKVNNGIFKIQILNLKLIFNNKKK